MIIISSIKWKMIRKIFLRIMLIHMNSINKKLTLYDKHYLLHFQRENQEMSHQEMTGVY